MTIKQSIFRASVLALAVFCGQATLAVRPSVAADSCLQDVHPADAVGSAIQGTSTGAQIALFDEAKKANVGKLVFVGKLWFFDGGSSTEVDKTTKVMAFAVGNFKPDAKDVKICASGKYFIVSALKRRFQIYFPSLQFSALVKEIE